MSDAMDNAIQKVVERTIGMALIHGTAFVKVTYDANNDQFLFNVLLPEHVTISYEKPHG